MRTRIREQLITLPWRMFLLPAAAKRSDGDFFLHASLFRAKEAGS
jgi:hypothetical protein